MLDKYEYNVKSDQIKKLYNKREFIEAAKIADEIDWRKVKDNTMLAKIADVYENAKQYEKAKGVLLVAYERSPFGRQLAYKLTILSLRTHDFEEADEFYNDFVEMSPKDVTQYILQYRIAKAKNEDIDVLIKILEAYVEVEMDERWQYELAKLYDEAGYVDKCVDMCDELILWFNDGKYVEKAQELRRKYRQDNNKSDEGNESNQHHNIDNDFDYGFDETEKKQEHDTITNHDEEYFNNNEIKNESNHTETNILNTEKNANENEQVDNKQKMINFGKFDTSSFLPNIFDVSKKEEPKPKPRKFTDKTLGDIMNALAGDTIDLSATQDKVNHMVDEPKKEQTYSSTQENNSDDNEDIGSISSEFNEIKVNAKEDEKNSPRTNDDVYKDDNEQKAIEAIRAAKNAAKEAQKAAELANRLAREAEEKALVAQKVAMGNNEESEDDYLDDYTPEIKAKNPDSVIEIYEFDKKKEGKGQHIGDELTKTAEIDIEAINKKIEEHTSNHLYDTANLQAALAQSMEKLMQNDQERQEKKQSRSSNDDLDFDKQKVRDKQDYHEEDESSDLDDVYDQKELSDQKRKSKLIKRRETSRFESDYEDKEFQEEDSDEEEDEHLDLANAYESTQDEEDEEYQEQMKSRYGRKKIKNEMDEDEYSAKDEEPSEEESDEEYEDDYDEENLDDEKVIKRKASANSKSKEVRDNKDLSDAFSDHTIPEEFAGLFSEFASFKGMESNIAKTLDNLINHFVQDGTSKSNNVIITGGAKAGKTTLGLSIIKAANRGRNRSGRKVAKVKASALNKRGVATAMMQIVGTDLIIEQAGNLMPGTIVDLISAMKAYTEEMLIILEDDKVAIDRIVENVPEIKSIFNNRLDIEEFEINDLVNVAKDYAKEQDYEIDDMGILALYAKIDDISGRNKGITIEEIEDIVDDAIDHSSRLSIGKLFGKLRKNKDEMDVLTEDDFL